MKEVVIVSACRTAIARFMGSLKDKSAKELAITVGKAAVERAGIKAEIIDEIVMGEVYQHMQGSLPAKQVSMAVGLPATSNACVVNQNCASGMRALEIACHNIMLGKTDIALVVGVESMTNVPYMIPKARMGHPIGCTALRIIVSLYYELERQGLTIGGASLCVGGGPAMASLWTRDI